MTRKINNLVDKKFASHMAYVKDADITNITNCMKRNLSNIRSYNINSYEKILHYYNTFCYWGKIDPDKGIFDLINNRAQMLKEHYEDFLWLYDRLCDYRSKKSLLGIIDNWLTFSMVSLDGIIEKAYKHYFDLDIMHCDENEVLVDLGAFNGDTVNDYVASYTGYKRIYCYEIVPKIYEALKDNLKHLSNIEFRAKGAGSKNGTLFISDIEPHETMHKLVETGKVEVPVVSIDEDVTEKLTFIKMDIEGGEQEALHGCKRHIIEDKPKLAISIYHNNEDIWKCARIIDEINPNYNFYFRYSGGNYYPSEYVLLATPKMAD